jgi:aerobic carbon-monoxide dehydrogenase large subunit
MERAAEITSIDRVELRRRNLIRPEQLPYHTPTHHNYDSGDFEKLMDRCLTLADWHGFPAAQRERTARIAARPCRDALYRARRRHE